MYVLIANAYLLYRTIILVVLLGVRDLLDNPNTNDPAQRDSYVLYEYVLMQYIHDVKFTLWMLSNHNRKDRVAYEKKIREQAAKFTPTA